MSQRFHSALSAEPDYPEYKGERPTPVVGQAPASNLLESAHLLWARRAWLAKAWFVGLLAGAVIALLIPARYESTVQLMPPDNQSSSGLAALATLAAKTGGMSMVAGDLLGVHSSGSLFLGILRSRTVEDRLIERFQLKAVYGVKLDEDARRELSQNTGTSEDRKSGILTLSVTDHDRTRAQAMAAAYVDELNRLVAELSTSAAHRERVFLEERLAAVKQDLDQATRDLSEFSSKNATVDVKEQAKAMVDAAATLQGELIAAESQKRAIEAIYTPNNVRVRAAEARVAELRRQLEKLGGKFDSDSTADAGSSETSNSDSMYPSLRKLPVLGAKYADLYRKTKIQEAVFETLTQQYEIAKVQEAKETPSVKLLDHASLPERRSFPPRTLIALLCGIVGLAAASSWILAKQRWDRIDAGDRRKQLAVAVFSDVNAMMPWSPPNGSRWQAATHKVWTRLRSRPPEDPQEQSEHDQEL